MCQLCVSANSLRVSAFGEISEWAGPDQFAAELHQEKAQHIAPPAVRTVAPEGVPVASFHQKRLAGFLKKFG